MVEELREVYESVLGGWGVFESAAKVVPVVLDMNESDEEMLSVRKWSLWLIACVWTLDHRRQRCRAEANPRGVTRSGAI